MGLFDFNLDIRPTLKVCMLGPRAVGKTTVLTSIFAKSIEDLAGTKIYIRPSERHPNTGKLTGFRTQLENAIENNNPAALPASMEETDFLFEIGMTGNPHANVDLLIKDYPGEFLVDSTKQSMVADFLKESDIILVAIDSPYLMEGVNLDNEKNKPSVIKDFIRKQDDKLDNKLILFIPLKCERYFHDGRIDELVAVVHRDYDDMKDFFVKHGIASYFVSIQTLGGVEYDRMIPNTNPAPGDPSQISLFRMYKKNPVYAPLFCSQPLFYLLTYVAQYVQWQQTKSKGFVNKLKDMLSSYLRKDAAFFNEILALKSKILINKAGCEIFTNNFILQL